jgi:hypothetical protein
VGYEGGSMAVVAGNVGEGSAQGASRCIEMQQGVGRFADVGVRDVNELK